MKSSYSEERRAKRGNFNRGKKLGEQTKSKLRQKALMRPPRVFTEIAIKNMKKKSKPLIVYNKDGTIHGEYSSILYASLSINCGAKTIQRALQSKSKGLKKR